MECFVVAGAAGDAVDGGVSEAKAGLGVLAGQRFRGMLSNAARSWRMPVAFGG
jgi:hypothetical protein